MDKRTRLTVEAQRKEYERARDTMADAWVPANGGYELPFVKNGRRWLLVINFATGKSGFLDLGQDIVYDDLPA